MSNDMFGTIAKAYMIADMMTPPRPAQVIHNGLDASDIVAAENAVVAKANERIRKANSSIRQLQGENNSLRSSMATARERILETARDQDAMMREQAERLMEMERENELLRAELSRQDTNVDILQRRLNAIENHSNATNVDIMDARETIPNGR